MNLHNNTDVFSELVQATAAYMGMPKSSINHHYKLPVH